MACQHARGHFLIFTGKPSPSIQTVRVIKAKISGAVAGSWPHVDPLRTAPELTGDVQRKLPRIPLGGLCVLMAYQGLNDLLWHLMLHEIHRKRIPERLQRYRPDGKLHTVTRRRHHCLTYQATRRVLTLYVPELRSCRQAGRRKPLLP